MEYAPYTVGTYVKTDNEGVENEYYNFDASALTYILINSVKEQQIQLDEKEERISRLENELLTISTTLASCCSLGSESYKTEEESSTINVQQLNSSAKDLPVLSQNQPNPFNEKSLIRFYLPKGTKDASIKVLDNSGAVYRLFALTGEGPGSIEIEANSLAAGNYYYTLLVGGNVVDTKTMSITR